MMKKYAIMLFLLMLAIPASAQKPEDVPFNGQILDASDKPVKKAEVWASDARSAVKTDKNGRFGLLNVSEGDTLSIMVKKRLYSVPVGKKKSILIHLWAEGDRINTEESKELQDMGFGLVKKKNSTRSGNHITGQELRESGVTDLLEALQGRVPGLSVSSNFMGSGSATIGGPSSLNASSAPIYVVDGMVVNSLSGYSVDQVDYVEISRDASMYGSRGAGGAIIVKTRGAN